jgi:hypothetical protein
MNMTNREDLTLNGRSMISIVFLVPGVGLASCLLLWPTSSQDRLLPTKLLRLKSILMRMIVVLQKRKEHAQWKNKKKKRFLVEKWGEQRKI